MHNCFRFSRKIKVSTLGSFNKDVSPQITATKLGVGETIINDLKNISDKLRVLYSICFFKNTQRMHKCYIKLLKNISFRICMNICLHVCTYIACQDPM